MSRFEVCALAALLAWGAGSPAGATTWEHSLALRTEGTVGAWEYNGFGQLGEGMGSEPEVPLALPAPTGGSAVAGASDSIQAVPDEDLGEASGSGLAQATVRLGLALVSPSGAGWTRNPNTGGVLMSAHDFTGRRLPSSAGSLSELAVHLELDRQRSYTIVLKKEGLADTVYELRNSVGGGWVMLDILLGGLIAVAIDAGTGAWYQLDDSPITIPLRAPAQPGTPAVVKLPECHVSDTEEWKQASPPEKKRLLEKCRQQPQQQALTEATPAT